MDDKSYIAAKCLAFLEADLEASLELQDIEKYMGYSRFYLNRVFSEKYGKTMQQYRRDERLKLAAERLRDTETEIADIALAAGYQSQQAFTQAFRQKYGCPPAEYRREIGMKQNNHQTWRCAA